MAQEVLKQKSSENEAVLRQKQSKQIKKQLDELDGVSHVII